MQCHQSHTSGYPGLFSHAPHIAFLSEYHRIQQLLHGRIASGQIHKLFHGLKGTLIQFLHPGAKKLYRSLPVYLRTVFFCLFPVNLLTQVLQLRSPQKPDRLCSGGQVRGISQAFKKLKRSSHQWIPQIILPPGHLERNPFFFQTGFQKLRLAVGAVQHRDVGKAPDIFILPVPFSLLHIYHIDSADQPVDFPGHKYGLRHFAASPHQPYRAALSPGGMKPAGRSRIMRNHLLSAGENLAGGPVIFLETDGFHFRKILLQHIEAPGVRSPESVNGLVRITDHKHFFSQSAPGLDQPVLHRADILKFIYQQILKPFAARQPAALLQKPQHLQKQIVKIHQTFFLHPLLIVIQRLPDGFLLLLIVFRFPKRHLPQKSADRYFQPESLSGLLRQRLQPAVVRQGELPPQIPQQSVTDTVESSDLDLFILRPRFGSGAPATVPLMSPGLSPSIPGSAQTFLHLSGRLFCEGHCRNLSSRDFSSLQHPENPGNQRLRLAGAGARNHGRNRSGGFGRPPLGRVQFPQRGMRLFPCFLAGPLPFF